MIGLALALQILVGSFGSSYFGILADQWDAGSKRCHGRLWIMFGGLAVSVFSVLMHLVAIVFVPTNESSVMPTGVLIYHLILRCINAIGLSATYPVSNGLTLARLERDGRDANEYGKERLYGAISWGVANSFFGIAIDTFGFGIVYFTTVFSFVCCGVVFYLYAKADDAIIASDFIEDADNNENTTDDACPDNNEAIKDGGSEVPQSNSNDELFDDQTLSDEDFRVNTTSNSQRDNTPDEACQTQFSFSLILQTIYNQPKPLLNISYVIALFTLYIGMSVVENLIFLYFEFLGGSNTLCGLTVAVTVMFELPIFHFAPNILKWMKSPVWMFQWGCLAYVVRVIGYSVIPESHAPWVLLFEPLHGVTIGFVLTGSVAFVDSLMPKGYESSGQGFISTVMGLGQFVGLCIGGVLEGRVLYRVLAGVVSIGSVILAIGHRVSTKYATQETVAQRNHVQLQQMKTKVVKKKRSDISVERKVYTEVVDRKRHDLDFEIT